MAKPVFDTRDFEKNRVTGALGYILFFVPLIVDGNSRFHRFCANQGALGWIVYAIIALVFSAINFFLGWFPLLGWLLRVVGSVLKLVVIAIMVYYGWSAYNGRAEGLPFIGSFELFR